MRLTCEVETTYLLAQQSGEGSKSKRIRASITVGKKKNSRTEEIVIIVSTTKNVAGTQYKVSLNWSTLMITSILGKDTWKY